MTKTTFTATIFQAEGKKATGIVVPPSVIEALGKGQRPPVKTTLAGYTYRTSIGKYGDTFLLPVAEEHREAAGVGAGDTLEITLELDTEPRTVAVPDDLAAALEEAGVTEAFEKSAPSARKEFVRQVESAKAQDTRERRIAKIVEKLSAG